MSLLEELEALRAQHVALLRDHEALKARYAELLKTSKPRAALTPSNRYRRVHAHGHPLAGKRGSVKLHRVVLFAKIGPGVHPCHWCGEELAWLPSDGPGLQALRVDHLDRDRDNNSPENLVPACNPCNSRRSARPRPGVRVTP